MTRPVSATAVPPALARALRRPRAPSGGALLRGLAAASWPAAVVAVAALAAFQRGTNALGARLWIDEGISIGIAQHPLADLPGLLRRDGSPPVYYVLLHWWIGLFGASPSSTHVLSVVFAVLAVPACAWAAWSTFGPRAGALAAALAAFVPLVGQYADETRMYTLAFLLAALATGAFLRAFVGGSRWWAAGCGALVALLALTHGWGLFYAAAAACAVLVALVAGPRRGRTAVNALLAAVVGAALFAPWVPTLLFQVAHTGAPWSHMPDARSLTRAGSRMLGGRPAETVLLVVAVGGLIASARRVSGARLGLACIGVIALVTVLAGYEASRLDQPVWALRYLALPLAPLILALGAGLDRAGPAGLIAAVAVCALFWAGKPSPAALEDKSNVVELAVAMRGELPPGTLVASPQPEQVPVLDYYLPGRLRYITPLGVPRDDRAVDWTDALRRLRASRVRSTLARAVRRLRPGDRVLLVQPRFGHPDSPWTRTVAHRERRWLRWLDRDRRFVELGAYVPARYASRATVAGVLYERKIPASHSRRT